MKIQKKYQSGSAKEYITRTQALRKLQISLADFRRLCIFKGIFPREPNNPRKANKGVSAPVTFYYAKDVEYLMHEPVLNKFREQKTFAKKVAKALNRGDVGRAKKLDDRRPKYRLDHVIRERYPSFIDVLRDLDDGLCMLFLFALMPSVKYVSTKMTSQAEKLCNQWSAYIAREKLLTKVFVSIRGIYYEAVVRGQTVRWLVPFKFPQNVPRDIDMRIMMTFLELYSTVMQFVLYRLYTEAGLVYPPKINEERLKGVGGFTAYILDTMDGWASSAAAPDNTGVHGEIQKVDISVEKVLAKQAEEEHNDTDHVEQETGLDKFDALKGDVLEQPETRSCRSLFDGFCFFIGREVPLDILEFVILAHGGRVVSESALDGLLNNEDEDASVKIAQKRANTWLKSQPITHQVCDRPALKERVPGRTYIQPQWVFDSINKGTLQSTLEYAPGEALPPHLSPWGDASSGYDPEAVEVEDGSEAEEIEVAEEDLDKDEKEEDDEEEEDDDDENDDVKAQIERQKELEQEAKGIPFSKAVEPVKSSKRKAYRANNAKQEQKDLKAMMVPDADRKRYEEMKNKIGQKSAREHELRMKKRRLAKSR